MLGNTTSNKSNIYVRDWCNFDRESFILDFFSIDWEDLLKTDKENGGNSTQMYF